MTKPDEYPQDVWDTAGLEAMKYVEWLVPQPTEYGQSEHVLAVSFARAILAERERCAGVARAATKIGNEPISMTIENAIRKGGA